MIRLGKLAPIMAALAVAVAMGMPSTADAAFAVRYSTNGGTTFTTVNDGDAADLDTSTGGIQVNIKGVGTVTVNSSATSSFNASIALMDLSINGSGLKGAVNLVVQASLTGINTAPPPLTLDYSFTGSVGKGAKSPTQTIQTWVDDSNGLFGTTGGGIVANTGALTIPASGTIKGIVATNPYSLTTSITLKSASGSTSYNISFDSNNTLTPSPAPASLLLAAFGAPVMGFGAWIRRRRNTSVVA